MRQINVTVAERRAVAPTDAEIICGNSDYTIRFSFDEEWKESPVKTARFVFRNDDGKQCVDRVFEGDTVAVPVMANTPELFVGVYAGDLKTTTSARIPCTPSIRCGSAAPVEPDPEVYDQIIELINSGVLKGPPGDPGRSAYDIAVDGGYEGTEEEYYAELSTFDEKAKGAKESELKAKKSEEASSLSAEAASLSAEAASLSAEESKKSADIVTVATKENLIKGEASGKIATTENAVKMPLLDLTVNDGTAVQTVKVFGKNFFNRNYEKTETTNGVTFYWDAESQELVLNGTVGANGDLKLVNPFTIDWVVGETYTISIRHTGGTATLANATAGGTNYGWSIFSTDLKKYVRGALGNTEFPELYSFSAKAIEPSGGAYVFYLQCWRTGTVFDNYRVKVQIEKGSTATDWEAYREETAALEDVQTLTLREGHNNVVSSPMADITLRYAVKTQAYIDDLVNGRTGWEGKKWFAFGTSITDTSSTNAETGTPPGKYVPYLAKMSGLSVVNHGIAGGTWGKGGAYGGSASILNRILSTDLSAADLITIEGCVNDFACAVPIGEIGDTGGTGAISDTEIITICGSLYRAVKHCLETAPKALVILLTESTGKHYTLKNGQAANYCVDKKNSLNLFQKDYNDATIEMGKFMGVRVIDAGSKSQINCFNPEYVVDQIHHTEIGGKQYATVIWDELRHISPKVTEWP